MVDVGGENRSNFKPKPLENANKVSIGPRPSLSEKAKLTIAAFVASLGIGGGAAATHPGQAADLIGGSVDKAIHVGLDDSQQQATDKVRKELAVKGIHFGDPLGSATATEPSLNVEGEVWNDAQIGSIPISGTIGIKYETQDPIFHTDPTAGVDNIISPEELKKLGFDWGEDHVIHAKVMKVVGGPYDEQKDPKNPEPGEWDVFVGHKGGKPDGEEVKIYVAGKFVKYLGKNELRIDANKVGGN